MGNFILGLWWIFLLFLAFAYFPIAATLIIVTFILTCLCGDD